MKSRRQPRDSGALILSYIIILPVFFFALMLITQAAMWYLGRSAALAAARQGVNAARVVGAASSAGVAAADSFAQQSGSGFLQRPRASAAGSSATTIKITVYGDVPSLMPGLPNLTISQVAEAPVERFTTP